MDKNENSRNQIQFKTDQIQRGHARDNSFKEIAGIENRYKIYTKYRAFNKDK